MNKRRRFIPPNSAEAFEGRGTGQKSNIVRYRPQDRAEGGAGPADLNVPADLKFIFAKTPCLSHEEPKDYSALLARWVQELKPTDAIEWLWIKDVADDSWEILRLLRIRPALLDAGRRPAVAELLAPPGKATTYDIKVNDARDEARNSADAWFEPKTRSKVEARLNRHGLDADSIMAVSFSMQAHSLEAVERMLSSIQKRRSDTLAEIILRREMFGNLLRRASDKLLAAESPSSSSGSR